MVVWLGEKEMRSKKVGDYQLHVIVHSGHRPSWEMPGSSQTLLSPPTTALLPEDSAGPMSPQGEAHMPLCRSFLPLSPPLSLWLPNHFSFLLRKPHSDEAQGIYYPLQLFSRHHSSPHGYGGFQHSAHLKRP